MDRQSEQSEGLVLVVDDEEITLLATQDMLEAAGFSVVTATSGLQAIEVFTTQRSELAAVVLDMTMPKMSGVEVFIEFQRLGPDVPVIFSSGYSKLDALEQTHGLPIAGFIQKPFCLETLTNAVNQARKGRPEGC